MQTYWFNDARQRLLKEQVVGQQRTWLVTGCAGFIGSNLIESLLMMDQKVIGLDNFATGYRKNLDQVKAIVKDKWDNFEFIEGDIRNRDDCAEATEKSDIVLHQAALGSVPRSIEDPLQSHDVNVTGFLNILDAARRNGTERFVYAASSSTYGDEPNLPKIEERIGNPLSPYAVTKLVDEHYASVYAKTYDFVSIGLRYFNVFGPRQDPDGVYAAVIPKWVSAIIRDDDLVINGDGTTSRDFCFVENAVQANIRAAMAPQDAQNQVYNVAVGDQTSLLELVDLLRNGLADYQINYEKQPVFRDFRKGDVKHSLASIDKARQLLDFDPSHDIGQGIEKALGWYVDNLPHRKG